MKPSGGEGDPVDVAVAVAPDDQEPPYVEPVVAGERLDPDGAAGQQSRPVAIAEVLHAALRRDAITPGYFDLAPGAIFRKHDRLGLWPVGGIFLGPGPLGEDLVPAALDLFHHNRRLH